jgi:hypothetical protein
MAWGDDLPLETQIGGLVAACRAGGRYRPLVFAHVHSLGDPLAFVATVEGTARGAGAQVCLFFVAGGARTCVRVHHGRVHGDDGVKVPWDRACLAAHVPDGAPLVAAVVLVPHNAAPAAGESLEARTRRLVLERAARRARA